MIEPFLILSILFQYSSASTLSAHHSDLSKIKCEALPYRSKYNEKNCYFAIEVTDSNQAAEQCLKVLVRSKVAKIVPDEVWRSLFVDKNDFLKEGAPTGFKKAMCVHENPYRCTTGATTSISGKCIQEGDKKMNYKQAEYYCSSLGSLPSSVNDIENRDVAAATTNPIWLRPSYSKEWTDRTTFSRFSSCAPSPFFAAKDPKFCDSSVATVANPDKSTRGYWALADQSKESDVVCVGEAESDFFTAPPKSVPKPADIDCKENHKWSGTTGRCEWTGPGEACVKLFSFENKTEYVRILGYPEIAGADVDFHSANNSKTFQAFVDKTTRAVVRRGCMATFWSNPQSTAFGSEMKLLKNLEHGDYVVPCTSTGTGNFLTEDQGLSRVSCYCDPYETEKRIPAKGDCAPNHEWSEAKRRCVWSLDDMYAGSIQTFADKKMLLEIPNWPVNKRFDVNLRDAKLGDFENQVNKIVVRQGCFCTIYSGADLGSWQPRSTINYGVHGCTSQTKKGSSNQICASMRIVCECMSGDSGKKILLRTPEIPNCINMHTYNEKTKRCEWTGPATNCMQITNTRNVTYNFDMNWPKLGMHMFWTNPTWDRQLSWMTVRRGCFVTLYSSYDGRNGAKFIEYKLLENVEYGTYRIPQKNFGDVEGGDYNMGTCHLVCFCDPANLPLVWPAPAPTVACLPGHAFDEQTGFCEWTRDKAICGEIRNEVGDMMEMRMLNYPHSKRFNWIMSASKEPNAKLFNGRIRQLLVRQHCFVIIFSNSGVLLSTVTYGSHAINWGAIRIQCDCHY